MRQNRGYGRVKIRADVYERNPYHNNSRKARDVQLSAALHAVWDRALAPRGRRSPTPAADEPTWAGLEGEG